MKFWSKINSNFRIVIKNSVFGMSGSVIGQILAMVSSIIMGRILGAEGLGAYTFGMTFAGMLYIFLNLGMSGILQRNISMDNSCAGKYLANTLVVRIFFAIPASLIMAIAFTYLRGNVENLRVTILCCIYVGLTSLYNNCNECITAIEKFEISFIYSIIQKALNLVITFVLLMLFKSMGIMLVGYIIGFIILVVLQLMFIKNNLCDVYFELDIVFLKKYIRESAPAILTATAEFLNLHCDIFVLSFCLSNTIVGYYSVSSNVYIAASFIPIAIAKAATPTVNRLRSSGKSVVGLIRKTAFIIIIVSFIIMFAIRIIGKTVVVALYGLDFEQSVIPLYILTFSLAPASINRFLGYLLLGIGRQKGAALASGVGAMINVILNIMFIPMFGMSAAAFSTVISESVVAIIEMYFVNKHNGIIW